MTPPGEYINKPENNKKKVIVIVIIMFFFNYILNMSGKRQDLLFTACDTGM